MWQDDLLQRLNRRKVEITFDPHAFERAHSRNLDPAKVEETVREGSVFSPKCEPPNKLSFQKYFGKENITYTVIVRVHQHFMEVKTVWPTNGR